MIRELIKQKEMNIACRSDEEDLKTAINLKKSKWFILRPNFLSKLI